MSLQPALYMLPVSLGDTPLENVLPAVNTLILSQLRVFIVENLRTARRFLREAIPGFDIDGSQFFELNNHTDPAEISSFLNPLRQGTPVGVMSEAGCPGVADPGAQAVAIAQQEGLKVVPLVGPSSILLALMGSGFNGQHFCFHGYLPVKEPEKAKALRDLEAESARKDMTQIFIETPYRNDKTIDLMARTLRDRTLICVASELTDRERERIITLPASAWRKRKHDFDKHPTIFLIHAR